MPTFKRYDTPLVLILIFGVALTVRLAFLYSSPDRRWPHAVLYEGDAPLYADWASALCDGRPFEFDLPIHSPGMAYLLMPFAALSHPDRFMFAKLSLCFLGAATCWLIARTVRDTLSSRVALIAGILSAASFPLALQCISLNNEAPYTLLLLIILSLTLNILKKPRLRTALGLGLAHGLAALFRAEHSLLWLAWTGYLLLPGRRGKTADSPRPQPGLVTLAALVFFLTALPWNLRSYFAITRFNTIQLQPIDYAATGITWTDDVRDYIQTLPAFARDGNVRRLSAIAALRGIPVINRHVVDDWFTREVGYVPTPLSPIVFISNQGALSFALANNAHADGGFSTRLLDAVMGLPAPEGHVSENDFAFANPRHLRLYQDGYRIGLRYLADHPADALRLMGKKLARFVDGLAGGFLLSNLPQSPAGTRWPVDQLASDSPNKWIWNITCTALILLGAWHCPHHGLRSSLVLMLVCKLMITLAFYGYARQAVSVQPFSLLLIAIALDRLILEPVLHRRPALRESLRPLAVLLVIAVFTSSLLAVRKPWSYDIAGPADAAPQWGAGAFLSHQPIHVRRITASEH